MQITLCFLDQHPLLRILHLSDNSEVYEHRKTNHLCFRCGERYTPGHTCRIKQLQCISGGSDELPVHLDDPQKVDVEVIVDLILTYLRLYVLVLCREIVMGSIPFWLQIG